MLTARKVQFLNKPTWPTILWFGAAIIIPIIQFLRGSYNNYKIFKGVFYHTINQTSLYAEYPSEYFDTNYYGPFFSIVIAPFAIMPDVIGMVLWSVFNTWLLYKAIKLLPLSSEQKSWMLWIGFIELTTTLHNLQSNSAIAAWVILAYVFIIKKKEFWAGLMILTGFFVKIYGIVALAFGVFTERKGRLVVSLILAAFLLFILPMLLSSPQFIFDSYVEWGQSLSKKNMKNAGIGDAGIMQNISVIGMITRIFHWQNMSVLAVLIPAAVCMLLPLVRFRYFKVQSFQLYYLAAVLLSIVLFSTGSESSTYIIAVIGAAVFFVIQPRPWSGWVVFLFVLMMLLTCLSPTDIFPKVVRVELIRPYSLKALPCFIIWLVIIFQLLFKRSFDVRSAETK
jgi:hypothetical protein